MPTETSSRGRSVLYHLGLSLITLGVLIALFLCYQIWFTNILQARTQHTAIAEVQHELPPPLHHLVSRPTFVLPVGPDVPLPNSRPAALGTWLGLLQIPKIHLTQAIIQGTDTDELRLGPGHYPDSPALGATGNVAIAGHRTTWGKPFRDLNELAPGDPIVITTPAASLLYRVTATLVVAPTNVTVLAATPGPTLTLTTCNPPYSAVSRLVVHARLVAVQRAGSLPPVTTTTTTPPSTTTTTTVSVTTTTTPPLTAQVTAAGGGGGWWPVVLYGLLFVMTMVYGIRWRRRSAHRWSVTSVLVVILVPVTLELFQGVSWLLPANY